MAYSTNVVTSFVDKVMGIVIVCGPLTSMELFVEPSDVVLTNMPSL
jgi:hypothetical protein